jgi:Methylase of chemotaxis methyl-accepting proteins
LSPQDFAFLAALIRDRSGLVITTEKAYLVDNRLKPLAVERGFSSLDGLVAALRSGRDEQLKRDVVELMTTNETLFFRDTKPFDLLRETVLPKITQARSKGRSLRIWSAACSTGQEAYSIAITVKENAARFRDWPVEIIGTDISPAVLTKARAGIYSQFEVQRGMPIAYLIKYFKQIETQWQISADLKAMVKYREHNVLNDLSSLGMFDVVFCRNLLIYFDSETKQRVLEKISKIIASDGLLFLGGTETVIGITTRFEPVPGSRGMYQLVNGDGGTQRLPRASVG